MRHGSHDDPVKPQGYRKRKSKLKAGRAPVYVSSPTAGRTEAARWLRK